MPDACKHCGFVNPPGMRFCGNCGSRLSEERPNERPQAAQEMGAMVGADLLERFRRAGLEAAGQRRNVTILFVDICGYTRLSKQIEAEELYELIRQFIEQLAANVYKYDGMVDKFTGDGLMALFGAPIAHENNAELAVRAALDMQADVARLSEQVRERTGEDLRVRIGLNAGTVIVGGIGSNLLMNYTAIGDTVNMAQRLEEAAQPGAILVSETVYHATRMLFDYEPYENILLKGLSQPITCYRVIRPKAKPGSVRGIQGLRAPMIGREAELRQLMQAIGALATYQQGQFIMIVGEAGLGKSRLVGEIKHITTPVPVMILEGQSLTYRRSVSYWIFQDLLRNYLNATPETPAEKTAQRLQRNVANALGKRAGEALPYLEHLLSLPPSEPAAAQRLQYLDAVQLRQQIFLAIRNLLVAEARRRPLLLILEDLHWADDASLDLLHFLLDSVRQAPLLILAITRPFEGGKMAEIATWAHEHLATNFTTIALRSLTPQQSQQLLQRLLAIPNLSETFREQVVARAAGIPLYLEEILRMLIDQGVLRRENGNWKIAEDADFSSLGVPETLQSLILARFDRLDTLQRRMLQVACVIGRQFSRPVLYAALAPVSEQEFNGTLARLIERDFILPQPDAPESEFAFRHVVVSDAIYSTLLRRDRAEIHGRVGEAIEKVFADRLEGQVEILARHYSWSNHKDRALHYLLLAGQKASRSYLNDQARQYYSEALELLPQVSHTTHQVIQAHMGLGDLLVFTGEYAAALEHYQRALQAISEQEAALYTEECSALHRKAGSAYERQGNYEEALRYLVLAEKILDADPLPLPAEKAQIYNDVGWIHFRHGEFDEAEKYLSKALALAQEAKRDDITASVYNRLGGVYFHKDQLEQASEYVQKGLALREAIGDIVAVARSYNNLGLLGWKTGQWDQAIAHFTRSVELHANLGDVEGMIELHGNLALLHIDRGDIEEAKTHLEKSLTLSQQIGHRYHEGLTYHYYSRFYLSLQEWRMALDYANRSMTIFKEVGDQDNLVDVYVNLGQAWLELGNLGHAQNWCEQALALFDQLQGSKAPGSAENRGRALRLLGEIHCRRGEVENAQAALEESAGIFRIVGNKLEQGRSAFALGRLANRRGQTEQAAAYLEQARELFVRLGARQDLAQIERFAQQGS